LLFIEYKQKVCIKDIQKSMNMNNSELELIEMQLIMNSGNAKSLAMEAMISARQGKISEAKEHMEEAEKAIIDAHKQQTQLLTLEANGGKAEFSILLTHSQDHLMNAITAIDIGKEVIALWESVHGFKGGKE